MFTKRELIIIELALHNRRKWLQEHVGIVPGASEKADEIGPLIDKVQNTQQGET